MRVEPRDGIRGPGAPSPCDREEGPHPWVCRCLGRGLPASKTARSTSQLLTSPRLGTGAALAVGQVSPGWNGAAEGPLRNAGSRGHRPDLALQHRAVLAFRVGTPSARGLWADRAAGKAGSGRSETPGPAADTDTSGLRSAPAPRGPEWPPDAGTQGVLDRRPVSRHRCGPGQGPPASRTAVSPSGK